MKAPNSISMMFIQFGNASEQHCTYEIWYSDGAGVVTGFASQCWSVPRCCCELCSILFSFGYVSAFSELLQGSFASARKCMATAITQQNRPLEAPSPSSTIGSCITMQVNRKAGHLRGCQNRTTSDIRTVPLCLAPFASVSTQDTNAPN